MKPEDVAEYALAEYALAQSRNYRAELSRIPMNLAGRVVLDLAAGPGTWTRLFAEAGARMVVWTDKSSHFCEYACEYLRGHPAGSRVAFVLSDLGAIPFRENTFDLVFCRLALHHSRDERQTLTEAARVLRGGGLLVLVAQRRGLVKEKGVRGPRKIVQYISPYIALLTKKKWLPTRYHIERVLYSRIDCAGLVLELLDASNPTSLYLLARKPLHQAASPHEKGVAPRAASLDEGEL